MGQLTFQATLGGAVNLAGPNTASTTTFTLPAADGTNGQALITNGSGTLSFGSPSAATPTALGTVYGKTDSSNTFLGYQVGIGSSTFNTAIGYQAYYNLGAGNGNNTAVGGLAGYSVTSGGVDAFGWKAGYSTTTGGLNAAFGPQSLQDNTTGSSNCAFGYNALQSNTTASNNTAVGYQSLYSNTTGNENTALSGGVLRTNTTGNSNTGAGLNALYANTTGTNHSAFGRGALLSNTTGVDNVAVGKNALNANTTGGSNTALGFNALPAITTSSSCTAIGASALNSGTAEENTAIGQNASYELTTGYHQTAVGFSSGRTVTTGIGGVYLGRSALASGTNPSYEIVVGSNSTGKGTQTGFINPSAGGVYQGNNAATWSVTSDQRLKKNIVDNNVGLSVINSIRVRNFEYRTEDEITELPTHSAIKKDGVQLGVIAQELQSVLPECVKTESTGVMSVDADNLTWYLINAVKELSARVKQLEGN